MDKREKAGRQGAMMGIVSNVFLCIIKFAVGLVSHSVAITADAANNLSDALSSVVSLFSIRMANKPLDKEHPFGHGRMEYIGALIVGILILFMGFELFTGSIEAIFDARMLSFSIVPFLLLLLSILVKLALFFVYRHIDQQTNSAPMRAAAKDSFSDALATCGIVVSMLLSHFLGLALDGYVGLLVAVLVLKSGYDVCRETIDSLLGARPSRELAGDLTKTLLQFEGIIGVHDLVIHDYGPGHCIASVHAEVPADANLIAIHEVIDCAERDIGAQFNIEICIHMDPIVTDDEATNALKAQLLLFLTSIDSRLTLHDFRRVPGEKQINLIFDVVLPLGYADEDALKTQIDAFARSLDARHHCILHFDKDIFQ